MQRVWNRLSVIQIKKHLKNRSVYFFNLNQSEYYSNYITIRKIPKEQLGKDKQYSELFFLGGGCCVVWDVSIYIWLPQKRSLVLPTSNANSWRIFSMLKKKTRYEVRIENDTECASMVTEQNQESACYKCEPIVMLFWNQLKYQSKLQN